MFGTNRKVFSQGIPTCNIKVLSLLVKKLCLRLSLFSKVGSKVRVTRSTFFGTNRKVLSQRTHVQYESKETCCISHILK